MGVVFKRAQYNTIYKWSLRFAKSLTHSPLSEFIRVKAASSYQPCLILSIYPRLTASIYPLTPYPVQVRKNPLRKPWQGAILCLQLQKTRRGRKMKIRVEAVPGLVETEVVVRCGKAGGDAARVVAKLSELEAEGTGKLTGRLEGQTYLLDPAKVLYADTADKRTFLYTAEGVYETELRLWELEERLRARDFFRASKSALVNFNAIKSLRPDMGGRIRLAMDNGEAVYVSRQYAPGLRERLGL